MARAGEHAGASEIECAVGKNLAEDALRVVQVDNLKDEAGAVEDR
jgi:hypothetical protein